MSNYVPLQIAAKHVSKFHDEQMKKSTRTVTKQKPDYIWFERWWYCMEGSL